MITYLATIGIYIIQFFFSLYIGSKIKPLSIRHKEIKEELNVYLKELEKEFLIKNEVKAFRLRILTLFMSIKDEDRKEEIRENMKQVITKLDGKPKIMLYLNLLTIFFSTLCIYFLLFFFKSEPLYWLSLSSAILVIFMFISSKRWIFSILFGAFSFFMYPHIPAHIMLYIFLNTLKVIVFRMITIIKKNKTKISI